MKAVLIKGLEMPTGENTFVDVRIRSNGTVLIPCAENQGEGCKAEEIEIEE